MSGVIIEPFTSVEAAERNFARLNEAIVALQGGSIAIENIEGYENLATKLEVEQAIEKIQYKVGDIHISESATNPAEKFGYGTWEFISKGRALVGIDAEDKDFETVAKTGGEKEVKLTVDQIPSHEHEKTRETIGGALNNPGWRGDYLPWGDAKGGMQKAKSGAAGGDKPHNNLQPYYCVYIWKRTK